MKIFHQVKLLIWKNYLLRRRQKIRCVIELLWPLFLFLILMWVRTRGLKQFMHECHFEEKALPSAGIIPFLQSFICSSNNTCHKQVQYSRDSLQNLNSTPIWGLLQESEKIFQHHIKSNEIKNLENVTQDFMNFGQLLTNIATKQQQLQGAIDVKDFINNPQEFKASIENNGLSTTVIDSLLQSRLSLQNFSMEDLTMLRINPRNIICDAEIIKKYLITSISSYTISDELCKLNNNNLTHILNTFRKSVSTNNLWIQLVKYIELNMGQEISWESWREMEKLILILSKDIRKLEDFTNTLDELGNVIRKYVPDNIENETILTQDNSTLFDMPLFNEITMLQGIICGPNTTNFFDQIAAAGGETPTRFDEFKDQMRDNEKEFDEYINDTEASVECNNLFRTLERNSITRYAWNLVKPFVRGKIIYAPNAPAYEKIMMRVNESFSNIEKLLELSQSQIIDTIKEQLINQTITIKVIKNIWPQAQDTIKKLLGSSMKKQFETIENFVDKFLDEDNITMRENVLNNITIFLSNVTGALECFELNKIEVFDTEDEAMIRGMKLLENNKLWAVVLFESDENVTDTLPPFVTYKIRMDSAKIDSTKRVEDVLRRPGSRRRPTIDLKYISFGFAYLQDIIESSIIKEHSGRNSTPGIYLQQFPYPCHIIDRFVLAISRTFPLFMTLSWVYTSAMIIKSIVHEKEKRLKETMRVMGLGNGAHWIGWFIDSIIPMIITVFILTLVLKYGKILEKSDPTLIFVFLLVFGITTVIKSFLVSVFFSKANLAAAAGGITFFVLYLPYAFIVIWEEKMSPFLKALTCLISNVSFGFGCSYLSFFEETGIGAQWSNYDKSPLLNDKLSLQACILLLMLDSVIYAILTWYIEAVFPGKYGIPKPWYFCLQKSYWFSSTPKYYDNHLDAHLLTDNNSSDSSENFECEPENLSIGVSLKNLSKTYSSNGKVALNNLTMNFYQDQITAFLGHNGAGKTTTISMLTGLFPPTNGTAIINGHNIRTDMDRIRGNLGTCPQHNVLFDQLTVEEHLLFYALIKGQDEDEVKIEIDKMINDLGLPHKKYDLAQNLSGGMQRKLSIAIAFIGGSKTVILDEPTSGVDPFSRRSIWELLVKYKKDRTVILTTHFMDEADLLADRIAIISGGTLRCCGSGLFLKSRFGSGFYLTIERTKKLISPIKNFKDGQIKNISEKVTQCITSATLLEAVGQELVYVLPLTLELRQNALPLLQNLLDTLDTESENLGINSFGISDTSLEEIFLKIADDGEHTASYTGSRINNGSALNIDQGLECNGINDPCAPTISNGHCNQQLRGKKRPIYVPSKPGLQCKYVKAPTQDELEIRNNEATVVDCQPTECKRKLRQFLAIQRKRYNHTKRNPKALFCEIILPPFFVCLALAMTMILPSLEQEPPLELKPWLYEDRAPNHVFYDNQSPNDFWANKYKNELLSSRGMGTRCIGPNSENCVKELGTYVIYSNESIPTESPSCSCSMGTQTCPADAGGPTPPKAKVSTGDYLYNLTNRNISDWLVKTEEKYYKLRYGGFSFGVHNPFKDINITRLVNQVQRLDSSSNMGSNRFDNYENISEILQERQVKQDNFDNIKVWFNNKGWPASVSYLNAINNVVLRASLPNDWNPELYGIKAINHPMNFTRAQFRQETIKHSGISLLHAISVIFAMSFVPASFVVTLIEERSSKSKHLQFVSGVDAVIYWVSAYVWDMCCYLIAATLCIIVFLIFDEDAYVSDENLPGVVLLLIFYGWSSIPLMYPASYIADVPSTAFVFLACANLFIGIVTTVTTFVLEILEDDELRFIGSILKEVFLIFPHFCLGQGLMKLATNHIASETLASFGIEYKRNIFQWNFLGKNLFAMALSGFVYFAFILAIELGVFKPLWNKIINKLQGSSYTPMSTINDDEEEDVVTERLRVTQQTNEERDVLKLIKLTKTYKKRSRPAVNGIYFGVHKGECFGLLGLNGAGKTSTFKMLTGDREITDGDAFICGESVKYNLPLVRGQIGYCPQFDALDALLTPREHLEFYSGIKGVPKHILPYAVDELLSKLGLATYADKCAGTLSGGNKRKLLTAIALVGNPPLLFLDEPTTGMDPAARRFLWQCIIRAVREGQSVVLTSHSMEECQALCSRLTVMVNGQLACLGSPQQLKNKFGNGYTLTVRCPKEKSTAMIEHMKQHLPDATERENHHTRLRFQVPKEASKLSLALGILENARENNLLYDYSISQTTLEEVFLRFAEKQTDLTQDELLGCTSCFRSLWLRKKLKINSLKV